MCGKRSDGIFTKYFDFLASNIPAILHINLYPITNLNRKIKEPNTSKLKTKQCPSKYWLIFKRKLTEICHSSKG
jgi:hypothetical protein